MPQNSGQNAGCDGDDCQEGCGGLELGPVQFHETVLRPSKAWRVVKRRAFRWAFR